MVKKKAKKKAVKKRNVKKKIVKTRVSKKKIVKKTKKKAVRKKVFKKQIFKKQNKNSSKNSGKRLSLNKDKKVLLLIMDGWGLRKAKKDNAIATASTPTIDSLSKKYPSAVLKAAEGSVGLPKGQMGNSEVGHMNLGAGRIVKQESTIITDAIRNKSFFKDKELIEGMEGHTVHIMGLVSDGGVHSHITHLFAVIELAKKKKKRVHVHAFLDGRDTEKAVAAKYLKQVEKKLQGFGTISTIAGRYYAMDRDNRWDRTEKAYHAINNANGLYFNNPFEALEQAYKSGETDEFVTPCLTSPHYQGVQEGDSIIFFNYREDRARQITRAFVDDEFIHFRRNKKKVIFVCMNNYDSDIKHVSVAFIPKKPENPLGELVSEAGMKQLRIAETEKYAHVTYFFNGTRERVYAGEDRILVPSPKVATYDALPEMSAAEITEKVVEQMEQEKYNLIVLNFANADMVGHTGIFKAAVKAVETVDKSVAKIVKVSLAHGYDCLITADHGNCEQMEGKWATTHSLNPVPLILVSEKKHKLKKQGILSNVAPTICDLLGLKKAKGMIGSLLMK